MANVTTVTEPNAAASGAPLSITPPADAFGANVTGSGFKAIGGAEMQASDVLAKHAEAFQAINNKAMANQQAIAAAAAVDALSGKYRSENQGLAMQANLGQFASDIEKTRAGFGKGLSPMAASEFDASSRYYTYKALSQVSNDAVTARKQTIIKSTDDATTLAGALAGAHPDDVDAQDHFKKTVGENAAYLARPDVAGLTDDEAKVWMLNHFSPVFKAQIKLAYDAGNLDKAKILFDEHRDSMTLSDQESVAGALRAATHANGIKDTAKAMLDGGQAVGPVTSDRGKILDSLEWEESRHQAGATGPMTPYGQAHGSMQVLDSTGQEMATKLGIPWQPDLMRGKTPEALAYQQKIGGAYFDQALERTNGDVTDALKYYHGGPNRKIWGPITDQYARDVLAHAGAGGSSITFEPFHIDPKADPEKTLADGDAKILADAQRAYPNDAAAYQQAINSAHQMLSVRLQQVKAAQGASFDTLDAWAQHNNVKDINALIAHDPTTWNMLPAKYTKALESQVQFNGRQVSTDTINNATQLEGMYRNSSADPETFLKADVRAMDLTYSDEQRYLGLQKKVAAGQDAPDKTMKMIKESLDFKASLAAVTKGEDAATHNTHYYQYLGALGQELDSWRQAHPGDTPKSADIHTMLSTVSAKVTTGGIFGLFGRDHPAFEYTPEEETLLRQALAQQGNTNPSARDLAELYWHSKKMSKK